MNRRVKCSGRVISKLAMTVIKLVPEPKRGTAAQQARRKRYQRIEDIKALIALYERRIDDLRTEAQRLVMLNH